MTLIRIYIKPLRYNTLKKYWIRGFRFAMIVIRLRGAVEWRLRPEANSTQLLETCRPLSGEAFMIRTRISTKRQPRRGFTLIELLVVISIIAVLVSLIAPAVQAARRTARKLECLNNMRQIGLAMQAFSATNGSLPPLTNDIPISNGNGVGYIYGAGWPMALLPALDATAVLKSIKQDAISTGGSAGALHFAVAGTPGAIDVTNTPPLNDNVWLAAFTCPDDADSFRQPGGLSFVVNAGFIPDALWGLNERIAIGTGVPASSLGPFVQPYLIDWNANNIYSIDGVTVSNYDPSDQAHQIATGVFFRPTAGANSNSFTMSLDYVSTGDGQTSTLMVSENLQAGPWTGSLSNGLTAYPTGSATGGPFGINQLGFSIALPMISGTEKPLAGVFGTGLQQTATTGSSINDHCFINRNLSTTTGSAPRPSSQHAGGVNVIMCDGSGRYLNETVDKGVYIKLLTSNGVTYGEQALDNRSY